METSSKSSSSGSRHPSTKESTIEIPPRYLLKMMDSPGGTDTGGKCRASSTGILRKLSRSGHVSPGNEKKRLAIWPFVGPAACKENIPLGRVLNTSIVVGKESGGIPRIWF